MLRIDFRTPTGSVEGAQVSRGGHGTRLFIGCRWACRHMKSTRVQIYGSEYKNGSLRRSLIPNLVHNNIIKGEKKKYIFYKKNPHQETANLFPREHQR